LPLYYRGGGDRDGGWLRQFHELAVCGDDVRAP
jgi:hypothetical protein